MGRSFALLTCRGSTASFSFCFNSAGVRSGDCVGQPRQRCPAGTLGSPDGARSPAAPVQRIPGAGTSWAPDIMRATILDSF